MMATTLPNRTYTWQRRFLDDGVKAEQAQQTPASIGTMHKACATKVMPRRNQKCDHCFDLQNDLLRLAEQSQGGRCARRRAALGAAVLQVT